jgi:two-component system response regulator HydG
VDIRLLAASNQDLVAEVQQGAFREDLFYRLNVVHIHLPDLRDRPEDIPLLAEHFLRQASHENGRPPRRLSREALELLMSHAWPGNVRELKNMMEQAVLLTEGEEVRPENLADLASEWRRRLSQRLVREEGSLEDMERCYIEEVLRQTGGQKGRASRILGIDRRTLYSKMRKYQLLDSTNSVNLDVSRGSTGAASSAPKARLARSRKRGSGE